MKNKKGALPQTQTRCADAADDVQVQVVPNKVLQTSTALEKLKFLIYPARPYEFSIKRTNLSGQNEWVVDRISSQETWDHGSVRPGDILESINEVPVSNASTNKVHTMLRSLEPASILRFRVEQPYDRCRLARIRFVLRGAEKLGVLVKSNGPESIPVVHSFPQDLKSGARRIQLGDALVAVNDVPVIGLGLQRVMELVAGTPRPITLLFQRWTHDQCRPTCRTFLSSELKSPRSLQTTRFTQRPMWDDRGVSNDDQEVVIIWRDGPLGLTLMRDSASRQPMVNRLTGKGASYGIHRLHNGCILQSINDTPTAGRRFGDVTRELSSAEKPLRLVFVFPSSHAHTLDGRNNLAVDRSMTRCSDSSDDESIKSSTSDISSLCSFTDSEYLYTHPRNDFVAEFDRLSTEFNSAEFNVEWKEGELGVTFRCQLRYDDGKVEEDHVILVDRVQPQPAVSPSGLIAPGDHLVAVNGERLFPDRNFVESMVALKSVPKPVVLTFERPSINAP